MTEISVVFCIIALILSFIPISESKYVLTCTNPYECDSNDLSAPANEDVHLFCESDHACQYATIDGSV